MKLLIFAPYGIGNLILLHPILQALKEKNISFDIASFLGTVDHMLEKWPEFSSLYNKKWSLTGSKSEIIATLQRIRKERYDVSVLSFPSAKPHYNILSFLCGATQKVGSRYPDDSPYKTLSFLNTIKVPVKTGLHDVFQNLDLVQNAGIELSGEDIRPVPLKKNSQKIIGFHLGCSAGGQYKRWPLPLWEQLLLTLKTTHPDYTLRLFFGPDEQEELEYFRNFSGIEIITELPLIAVKEKIGESTLFISNDSGLMHIAAISGIPVIALNGPSDEIRTGPYSEMSSVLTGTCPVRPCSHSFTLKSHKFNCEYESRICLESISVERVLSEIDLFLEKLQNFPTETLQ